MINGLNFVEMSRIDTDYGGAGETSLKVSVRGAEAVIDRLEDQLQSLIYDEDQSNG